MTRQRISPSRATDDRFAQITEDLARTFEGNRMGDSRLERTSIINSLPPELVPEFRGMARSVLGGALRVIDQWLEENKDGGENGVRCGVAMFQFDDK